MRILRILCSAVLCLGSVQKRRSLILDLDRPTSPVQRCVSPLNRTDSPQVDNTGLISAGTPSSVIKPSMTPYVTQNVTPNKTSYSHQMTPESAYAAWTMTPNMTSYSRQMTPASPYVTQNMMPNTTPQSQQVATVPPLHQNSPVTPNIAAQTRQTAPSQHMTPTSPRMISSSTISTSPVNDTMMISLEYTSKCSSSSVTTLDNIVKATTQKQATRDPVSSRPAPPPAAVKPKESCEKAVAKVVSVFDFAVG